jgi:hypothetical protein
MTKLYRLSLKLASQSPARKKGKNQLNKGETQRERDDEGMGNEAYFNDTRKTWASQMFLFYGASDVLSVER